MPSIKQKAGKKNGNKKVSKKSTNIKEKSLYIHKPVKSNNKKSKVSGKSLGSSIPSYKIVNNPGFSTVLINLKKEESVFANYNSMSHMDNHIKCKASSRGGIFAGLKRLILTTTSMFQTEYIGTKTNNNIAFASFLPGDILPLKIKPGDKYMVSANSLICYTSNLEVNAVTRFKGILVGEGIAQTEVSNDTNTDGMVWLASYGGFNKKTLKEGQEFKLDTGLYLCGDSNNNYTIGKIGSIKTAFLSGEGLVMTFKGPCEIYCQGRSVGELENYIYRIALRANSSK
jgi:uncharacterized protein (TIGR00266 family)